MLWLKCYLIRKNFLLAMMDVYFSRIKPIFFSWMAFRYQFDIIDNGRQGGVQRQARGFNRFFCVMS